MREWNLETLQYEDMDQAEMVDAEGENDKKDVPKGKAGLKKIKSTFKKAKKRPGIWQGEDDNE